MCLAIDDDGGEVSDSLITDVPIPAGGAITVAATSFDETDSGFAGGSFTLIITRR
jgi:hypothetical protein